MTTTSATSIAKAISPILTISTTFNVIIVMVNG